MKDMAHTALDSPLVPLHQSSVYMEVLDRMGVQTGAVDIGLPHPVRYLTRSFGALRALWLPRGPQFPENFSAAEKRHSLRVLSRALPRRALWITTAAAQADDAAFRAACHLPLLTPQYHAELDLTPSPEERMRAQQGKWRNRLRRALDTPLLTRSAPFDLGQHAPLLEREAEQRKTRGYRGQPLEMIALWPKHQTRVFLALKGGETVAYMICLLHAPVATYQIGWAGQKGRAAHAHTRLMWEASNWLARHGYTRLDLGTVDTDRAPSLARFKLGTGARLSATGTTFLHL